MPIAVAKHGFWWVFQPTPIVVSPSTVPDVLIDEPYTVTFTATGGSAPTSPFTFSYTGTIPTGTTLDSATGILSGTPTTAGEYTFTIIATDPNGYSGSREYTVEVILAEEDFPNPNFNDGFDGWTVVDQRYYLNGGSTILGFATPTDPTPNPTSGSGTSPGDGGSFAVGPSFSHNLSTFYPAGGAPYAAQLNNGGTFSSAAGGIFYGPVLYSNNPVKVDDGDTISFEWYATSDPSSSVGDAYNVYAYMLNPITGDTITILDANSTAPGATADWQTATLTINSGQAGAYHFVFLCGSFDSTFGRVVGSSLIVDNVRVIKAT